VDPDQRRFSDALGRALEVLERGDVDALDLAVEQLDLLRPQDPATACLRASLARLRGNPDEARQRLAELRQDPAAVDALPPGLLDQEWALALADLGQLDEARAALERATLQDPTSAARWLALGDLRLRQGDHEPAMAAWSHASRAAPQSLGPLLGAALTRELQGNHDEARGWLLAALLRQPQLGPWVEQAPKGLPGDRAWLWALLCEELGRPDEARAWLDRALQDAQGAASPHVGSMRAARDRLDKAGPVVLGQGPLPLWKPSAAVAAPQGAPVALADGLGRLMLLDLKSSKVLASPSLGGPAVMDMAWTREGLFVAYEHGWVGVYDPAREFALRQPLGPVAMPSGTLPRALSRDGVAVLASQRNQNTWAVGLLSKPSQERAPLNSLAGVQAVALGPWSEHRDGGTLVALLNTQHVQRWLLSAAPEALTAAPPRPPEDPARLSDSQAQALALTADGRHVLLAGPRHLAVLRASDLSPVRYLDLGPEASLGEAAAILPDPAGSVGFGPCVIIFHERRFRALRLDPDLLR
jgi:tetratricopeptide (TPR) repeat protein